MQFQFNSDYPGLTAESVALGLDLGIAAANALASDPHDFPPVQPIPCARITTRIYHPIRNEVSTVQNVLVRTMMRPPEAQTRQTPMGAPSSQGNCSMSSNDDFSLESSSSSSEAFSDMEMADGNTASLQPAAAVPQQQQQQPPGICPMQHDVEDRAYWIQRTLREAIYGRVLFATVLRRRRPPMQQQSNHQHPNNNSTNNNQQINAEWEVTSEYCAVKEMSKELIRKERHRLAEDPIKEVSAMQYLKACHQLKRSLPDTAAASKQAVMETHVMMPLDLLADDRNLYSIMPYCDGGELFERLDMNERFSEDEARYWMHQVLTVSQ